MEIKWIIDVWNDFAREFWSSKWYIGNFKYERYEKVEKNYWLKSIIYFVLKENKDICISYLFFRFEIFSSWFMFYNKNFCC